MKLNNTETEDPIYKACFLVQGHADVEKNILIQNANNIREYSESILVAISAVFGFRIYTQEVSQAYLHSEDAIILDVYVRTLEELKICSDEFLKLLKPLYGFTNSGD